MPQGSTDLNLTIDLEILGQPVTVVTRIANNDTMLVLKPGQALGQHSLGDLLNFLIKLAEPSRSLQLEAPWDKLNDIPIPAPALEWNLTRRSIGFTLDVRIHDDVTNVDSPRPLIPDVLTLSQVGISFQRDPATQKKQVNLTLTGSLFDSPFAPDPIDLLRRPPPSIPDKTPPIFDLDYLGLGQHVALKSSPETMAGVIDALSTPHAPIPSGSIPLQNLSNLQFDASAGWLIGTKFSALNILALSAIFNDPNLYGLLLNFNGDKAPAFVKGFSFEILYRKVSDNVGVYHIELKLPDQLRQIDVGEASLTLPIIDLDIFTNGNFLVDFGFPWNRDFTRSLTFQIIVILPVTGAGGFYFGVLDPQTAVAEGQNLSAQPPVTDKGVFGPVVVFGIAVQIGLGKTIQKGILQAGFALVIDASLEGVLAIFRPNDGGQSAYFKLTGSVGLTIHLFGSIDFGIIRARVDVLLTASVQVVFEVFKPVIITAQADVSVSLEVDVNLGLLSFTIHLAFSASITETFQIGHASPAPWDSPAVPAPAPAPFGLAEGEMTPRQASATMDTIAAPPTAQFQPIAFSLTAQPEPIALFFQPMMTMARVGESAAAPQLVAMLFIEASAAFEKFASGMLESVLTLFSLSAPSRNSLRAFLEDRATTPLTFDQVSRILASDRFSLDIQALPSGTTMNSFTAFPMLPSHRLSSTFQYTTAAGDLPAGIAARFNVKLDDLRAANPNMDATNALPAGTAVSIPGIQVDFATTSQCSKAYVDSLVGYFAEPDGVTDSTTAGASDPSMAALLLTDYFQAAIGELVKKAIDTFPEPADNSRSFTYRTTRLKDTLPDISSRFRVGIVLLQSANPGLDPVQQLTPGTRVLIPDSAPENLADVIQGLTGSYEGVGSSAAAFLLHGLRLPAPDSSSQDLSPLYVLSGQQSPAPPMDRVNNFSFTLTGSGSASATVSLTATDLQSIANATPFDPRQRIVTKIQFPPYAILPRTFALGKPVLWGPDKAIFVLPASLRSRVASSPNEAARLDVMSGAVASAGSAPEPPTAVKSPVWFTQVDFSVRRVPDPGNSGKFLSSVYEIAGTDFEGRDDLQRLIEALAVAASANPALDLKPTIDLLYPADAGKPGAGLKSDRNPKVVLLKSNLSTGVHEPAGQGDNTFFSASPSNPADFLTLLWECSVVATGGYTLIYSDQDGNDPLAGLFLQAPTTRLTLMASIAEESNPTRSFHNCVVSNAPGDSVMFIQASTVTVNSGDTLQTVAKQLLDRDRIGTPLQRTTGEVKTAMENLGAANAVTPNLLHGISDSLLITALVRNAQMNSVIDAHASRFLTAGAKLQVDIGWVVRRASIPPGNIGFRVVMNKPGTTLEKPYSMLSFRLTGDGGFKKSTEGVPVAPAGDGTGASQTFDRILPIAALAKSAKAATGTIQGPDPYGGVGTSAFVVLQPQDIFGNRCLTDADAPKLEIPVAYRDELIGLNQWPRARCSYRFEGGPAKPQLVIRLDLDPRADNNTDEVGADLDRYAQIYFQMAQDDVSVSASTSVGTPDVTASTAIKPKLLQFAVDAHAYLTAGGAETPTTSIPIPVSPKFSDVIFDLTASVTISRRADLIDALFDGFDRVQTVTSDLKPRAATAGTGDETGMLRDFAGQFQSVFPDLRLALGGDPSALDPNSRSKVLAAVHLKETFLDFRPANTPRFFAVKPLSTTPWSGANVPIQVYAGGKLLNDSNPPLRNFRGIDLDGWGRDFLSTLDFFLTPPLASIAQGLIVPGGSSGDAFTLAAKAKARLAQALGDDLAELVDPPAGSSAAVPQDVKDTLYEQLLVSLSEAYAVDAVVQFPVTVQNPSQDQTLRLNLLPAGVTFTILQGATLTTLAAEIDAPLPLLLKTIAAIPGILTVGSQVNLRNNNTPHTIAAQDTLASILGAANPEGLATSALATQVGFLKANASLDVFVKTYTAIADDNLRSVIDYLAPPISDAQSLADAIANFAAMNADATGLFAARTVTISGRSHTIENSDTLPAIAAALGVAREDFVNAALDAAHLIRAGAVYRFLARTPGFTLSAAQVDKSFPFLTTLFQSQGHTGNMSLNLNAGITGLERKVGSPVFAPRYESSEWLSFLVPADPLAIGNVEIPIPLRAYPLPPSLLNQALDQNELPDNPPLADLVNYEYSYSYSYTRAAQDQLFARISANVDNPVQPPAGKLPFSLAQFYSIASDLKRDLAARKPDAVATFATLADQISKDWEAWDYSPPAQAPGSIFRVLDSRDPDGTRITTLRLADGPDRNVRLPSPGPAKVADDIYTHEVPEQNAIDSQSIAGSVQVTRNASLVSGHRTKPEFVYQVPDVRFPSPVVPLLRYSKPVDVIGTPDWPRSVPADLESKLIALFTLVLHLPKAVPAVSRFIRVAVSYEFILAGNEPAEGTVAGAEANVKLSGIATRTPVLLRPKFEFKSDRDLAAEGFCAQLASALNQWLQDNQAESHGGHWALDLSLYASETSSTAPPLLEITNLRLPV